MADPTSSSFAYQWSYDVFLSFRGEDTRSGFTGNLYHALRQKGVNTFFDDRELRKGEEITPALMKAIQESRIAIVIFSENYASSTFCLQELETIMECFKQNGRFVWPVFYKVDPSDVRHQRGSYEEALAKYETRTSAKDKVEKWRLALTEAANLCGSHFKQGYEYVTIGDIVQEVSKRINRIPLYVANYPVGLESRVHKVKSLLDVESNDGVHMVGIYGTGGIGKTTLACAVYNFIADQFESLCFLDDIRENSMKHGLVQLQETLLSDIVGEKDIKLGSVNILHNSKYVINILHNSHGLAPYYSIKVLIDKCLIKIVNDHVRIHNLIENMGREIVQQESPSPPSPGKRSRLWESKDIISVLKRTRDPTKLRP